MSWFVIKTDADGVSSIQKYDNFQQVLDDTEWEDIEVLPELKEGRQELAYIPSGDKSCVIVIHGSIEYITVKKVDDVKNSQS